MDRDHLNAANYRFLKLIAEFDRCHSWGGDGATHSCAHWLSGIAIYGWQTCQFQSLAFNYFVGARPIWLIVRDLRTDNLSHR